MALGTHSTNQTERIGESQVQHLLDSKRPLIKPETLPIKVDVVVVGGGIVGMSTAYFLSQRGLSVVVCEKGRIACEQSGRNWGWVRQQGRADAELPMMMRSSALWREWQQSAKIDTGFEQHGCLYLAKTEQEMEEYSAWLKVASKHGLETKVINQAQLSKVLRGDVQHWAGALYTASDGRAEPRRAVPAITQAAQALGVIVIEHCAVRGIETSAGQVCGVVTEQGLIQCQKMVCAAGAWTSLLTGSMNVQLPQLKIKGTVARLAPAAHGITQGTAWAPGVAIRRRQDGGYTVAHGSALEHALVPSSVRWASRFWAAFRQEHGAARIQINADFFRELCQRKRWALDQPTVFEKTRVLNPAPSTRILAQIKRALVSDFPSLANLPVVESWAGMIDVSPDMLPTLSDVEQLPGLVIATGFSGHGFGLGPGAGESLAKMMCNESSEIDISPFRYSRFFDGSKLNLGPTL